MVSPVKAWSYSRYETYARCPLQFKLRYIDKLEEPKSPAMERGNVIHQGIARWLTGMAEALPREAFALPRMEALLLEVRAIPDADKMVEQQWGYNASWAPTGWFGKDTWFRSVLDVGVMYADLTFEALDWKTGKRYGSNDDQMETQALAAKARLKATQHITTRLVYLDSGHEEFAEFPAHVIPSLQTKWESKVAPMFVDEVFAPRPNDKCRFCHFSRSNGGPCAFG